MKPKVFIGSSVESLKIANAIQSHLDYTCETTVWKDGYSNYPKARLNHWKKP